MLPWSVTVYLYTVTRNASAAKYRPHAVGRLHAISMARVRATNRLIRVA